MTGSMASVAELFETTGGGTGAGGRIADAAGAGWIAEPEIVGDAARGGGISEPEIVETKSTLTNARVAGTAEAC